MEKYIKPICKVFEIETTQMLAMSGNGSDSDDTDFVTSVKSRGEWGNLWE